MNRSDYNNDGVLYSDMRVAKQPDGRFAASFPAVPQVPVSIGRSESEACELAKLAFLEAHTSGKIGQ